MLFQRIQVIDFKAFMKGEQKEKKRTNQKWIVLQSFIPLHPAMFIDTNFIMIAAGVLVVAIAERTLAYHGHVEVAEAIYTFLKVAFPIVGFAAMYFLIRQLSF